MAVLISRRSIIGGVACLPLAAAAPAQAPLPVRQIAPRIYVHQGAVAEVAPSNRGLIANLGFVVGSEAVAVVDTGASAYNGRVLRAAIRRVTDLPVRYVVNTHVHPDHVFGNAAFQDDDPVFVGHAKLPRAMAERGPFYLERLQATLGPLAGGTTLVPPTMTVEDTALIDLGNRTLRLEAHRPAHTDNDLSVHDLASGTLFAGDLLFMQHTPVLDGGLLGWLDVIEGLRREAAARVVPGHGPAQAPWPDALAPQTRYLERLRDGVRAAIADGLSLQATVDRLGRDGADGWQLYATFHPRNVTAAYAELEWE